MKRYYLNILVIGFALFSMFFERGNIIFPPYLGLEADLTGYWDSSSITWPTSGLGHRSHLRPDKKQRRYFHADWPHRQDPGKLMVSVIVLCIGPIIAIPRTGASVHEMLVLPHTDSVSPIVTTAIFFAIVLVLTIRESASGYPGKIPDAPALHRTAAPDNIRYRFTFRRHRFRSLR